MLREVCRPSAVRPVSDSDLFQRTCMIFEVVTVDAASNEVVSASGPQLQAHLAWLPAPAQGSPHARADSVLESVAGLFVAIGSLALGS